MQQERTNPPKPRRTAPSHKGAFFVIRLTERELCLLEECVSRCIPMLVCDLNQQNWLCCPSCHNVVDADYAACCCVCGQALSWYGTAKRVKPFMDADRGDAQHPPWGMHNDLISYRVDVSCLR